MTEALAERARYERKAGRLPAEERLTLHRLSLRYLEFAERYYAPRRGKPSNEVKNIRDALKALWLYQPDAASSFSAMKLRACREWMIEQELARTTINQRVQKIRRMFKWASSREIVSAEIWHQLQSVEALAPNRSEAKETKPVKPVPESQFWPALAFMSKPIRAMCELQWWTGMRPGEVVIMRGEEIRLGATSVEHLNGLGGASGASGSFVSTAIPSTSAPWTYQPPHHKTEHFGKTRTIYLGPHAQSILQDYMKPGYLFLSRFHRPYTVNGYGLLVRRACDRAGIDSWSPNRLRHSAAERIRGLSDRDTARAVLGHSDVSTTEIYLEQDHETAMQAALKFG